MADLQQTTMKVIALMAKYAGEPEVAPSVVNIDRVTSVDFSVLEILVDVLTIANEQKQQIDDLRKEVTVLRAATFLCNSEPQS